MKVGRRSCTIQSFGRNGVHWVGKLEVGGMDLQRFVQMHQTGARTLTEGFSTCRSIGVQKSLIKRGVQEGDTIIIGELPTVLDKQGAQLLVVAVLVLSRTWISDCIASLNGTTVKYVLEQDKAAFVRLIGVSVVQSLPTRCRYTLQVIQLGKCDVLSSLLDVKSREFTIMRIYFVTNFINSDDFSHFSDEINDKKEVELMLEVARSCINPNTVGDDTASVAPVSTTTDGNA
ncbi:ABC transporter D family member 1 [Tanacetum coccineum]